MQQPGRGNLLMDYHILMELHLLICSRSDIQTRNPGLRYLYYHSLSLVVMWDSEPGRTGRKTFILAASRHCKRLIAAGKNRSSERSLLLGLHNVSSIVMDFHSLNSRNQQQRRHRANKSLGSAGHQLTETQFAQAVGLFDHFYLSIDLVPYAFNMGYHADQLAMGMQTLQR